MPEKVDLRMPRMRLMDCSLCALSIPIDKCYTFSTHPLKWLRFLGYTIYGAEGRIHRPCGGPEVDYESDIQPGSYYFVSDAEPCIIDVDGVGERTSDASDLTERRATFRQDLINRDETCIVTGSLAENCQASHIIPHAKGDDYMANCVSHRQRDGSLQLSGIDDARNGLLLASILHRAFGDVEMAFLHTPNFAMTVDDVPYITIPEESPDTRLTLQHFKHTVDVIINHFAPHNSDARQPNDTSMWPPPLLLDFSYGCAALEAWAPSDFVKRIRDYSRLFYYEDSTGGDDDNDAEINQQQEGIRTRPTSRSAHLAARRAQAAARESQVVARNEGRKRTEVKGERKASDMMDIVMTLWMSSSRTRKKQQEENDHRDTQNKVKAWLESM